MTEQVIAVIGAIGVLIGLAGGGGVLYASFKNAGREATETRLRAENADYLGRLNYIEPRLKAAEEQNKVLVDMVNPSAKLEEIVRLLRAQGITLHEVRDAVTSKPTRAGSNDG